MLTFTHPAAGLYRLPTREGRMAKNVLLRFVTVGKETPEKREADDRAIADSAVRFSRTLGQT